MAIPLGWRSALLLVGLAAVAVATYAEVHWDPGSGSVSPYPVHLDEYFHWGYAKASADQGTIAFGDPYNGGVRRHAELASDLHERGFQAYLGSFQQATGIAWIDIFHYGPTVVALVLALCLFALLEPWRAGVEAVILLALVPTSLRFLGPGFLVPIVFSLPLVIAGVYFLAFGRGAAGVTFLGILSAALWPIHAMGALLLAVIVAIWALFSREALSARIASALVVAVTFLATWPFYGARLSGSTGAALELPASLPEVRAMGALLFTLAAVGAFAVPFAFDRKGRAVHAIFAAIALLMAALVVGRLMTGEVKFRLYDRTVSVLPFMLVVVAALGVAALVRLASGRLAPRAYPAISALVCAALLVPVGHAALVEPREDRYLVLDDATFAAYTEAAQKLPPDGLALVDGISTMAFTAITGHPTLFVQDPGAATAPPEIARFFAEGATDTSLLLTSNVSIVATHRGVQNPALVPVAPGVYVLDRTRLAP